MSVYRYVYFCVLAMVAASCAPCQPLPDAAPVVDVFIPVAVRFETALVLLRAEAVATRMYAGLGVRLVWHAGARPPQGCISEPMHSVIVIALKDGSPRGTSEDALGWATLNASEGPCVTLLMRPLEEAVRAHPAFACVVTGHALAHEIGHVLEGVARHSETGLMRERWSLEDVVNMQSRWLEFAAEDATLIHDSFRITTAAR